MIEWLEKHLLSCPIKHSLNRDCAGCGLQRSVLELLKGNIIESISLYPPLIPIILMFILLIIHLKFNLKHGALILKIFFIFNAIIILLNFLIKTI